VFNKVDKLRGMEQLATTKLQNIQCICKLLEFFINKDTPIAKKEKKNLWTRKLYAYFAYSVIWACGSAFTEKGQRYLDNTFRDLFAKLRVPKEDTVF
jgi:dynein heavy chain